MCQCLEAHRSDLCRSLCAGGGGGAAKGDGKLTPAELKARSTMNKRLLAFANAKAAAHPDKAFLGLDAYEKFDTPVLSCPQHVDCIMVATGCHLILPGHMSC